MPNKEKVRLALGILSGRINLNWMDNADWDTLGYDPFKFGYYGRPSDSELKEKAENILVDAICPSHE